MHLSAGAAEVRWENLHLSVGAGATRAGEKAYLLLDPDTINQ